MYTNPIQCTQKAYNKRDKKTTHVHDEYYDNISEVMTLLSVSLVKQNVIWYRVLPQGERPFLFAVRVGCAVIWPIFSTSKMKAFCIYFYQGNITFKNIINLVSFTINSVEYLVMNSYSVTVWDNFRKETTDSAKKHLFLEVFNSLTFILGNPPTPTSMVRHLRWRFDECITLTVWIITFFFTTSLQVREFCSCFTAAWHSLLR